MRTSSAAGPRRSDGRINSVEGVEWHDTTKKQYVAKLSGRDGGRAREQLCCRCPGFSKDEAGVGRRGADWAGAFPPPCRRRQPGVCRRGGPRSLNGTTLRDGRDQRRPQGIYRRRSSNYFVKRTGRQGFRLESCQAGDRGLASMPKGSCYLQRLPVFVAIPGWTLRELPKAPYLKANTQARRYRCLQGEPRARLQPHFQTIAGPRSITATTYPLWLEANGKAQGVSGRRRIARVPLSFKRAGGPTVRPFSKACQVALKEEPVRTRRGGRHPIPVADWGPSFQKA